MKLIIFTLLIATTSTWATKSCQSGLGPKVIFDEDAQQVTLTEKSCFYTRAGEQICYPNNTEYDSILIAPNKWELKLVSGYSFPDELVMTNFIGTHGNEWLTIKDSQGSIIINCMPN